VQKPVARIENLLKSLPKRYSPGDRDLIRRAYQVARESHKNQKRASGEPYIHHCIAVAQILADLRVPPSVIAAGLLHDVIEDSKLTIEDLQEEFGEEIAHLVDGVTKLTHLPRVSRGDRAIAEEEAAKGEGRKARSVPSPEGEIDRLRRERHYHLTAETWRKTFLAMGEDIRVVLIKLADRLHKH
jgi:GTP pyrophosphokinase